MRAEALSWSGVGVGGIVVFGGLGGWRVRVKGLGRWCGLGGCGFGAVRWS